MTSQAQEQSTVVQDDQLEIWENQSEGRVSMEVDGELGRNRRLTARGKGQRIRLSRRQRRIVQESIRQDQNDPFRNGKLRRLNRQEVADGEEPVVQLALDEQAAPDELSDDDLNATFLLEGSDFEEAVKSLSAFNIHRLRKSATVVDAKGSQIAYLNDYIAENLTAQGDTPTYREIQQVPDSAIS